MHVNAAGKSKVDPPLDLLFHQRTLTGLSRQVKRFDDFRTHVAAGSFVFDRLQAYLALCTRSYISKPLGDEVPKTENAAEYAHCGHCRCLEARTDEGERQLRHERHACRREKDDPYGKPADFDVFRYPLRGPAYRRHTGLRVRRCLVFLVFHTMHSLVAGGALVAAFVPTSRPTAWARAHRS